jgi:hypothetical protein
MDTSIRKSALVGARTADFALFSVKFAIRNPKSTIIFRVVSCFSPPIGSSQPAAAAAIVFCAI